ncbi:methylamine methyltransferase corrinoid protein reductive activase [Methanohalophilus portucalensis]|uniref:4Fe-4S ferredoxin iron-sulfur binding domain protein n=2 Tax=Methanohalophilus portucalensis TaxID=39664 RepID=A0A1L9C3I9_9EURY|nr:methylamine methyltransferase corrinoid protein reductive activase [Methanohalophilus portucalensis]ATU07547.1 methylamine utilization protein [Methanohalophilus portucalensis]OJH48978.1 4Fe-4S ferredoxin iron-sulfur binding domain protein [Methanohalophilus portucalensis FDF-1]RNI10277.1 methylamine methyltransferase corrinoid protein reductive activase [Methanohalophilus portucalensis FDF-1]SMH38161.1 methylamine methyltransferase corrinoid activation protein [Methanohalophilus portucalens
MYGIALDLGTSGFRAQLIDLDTKDVLKTAITMRHPLPGGNVMDHLDFSIQVGPDISHEIMMDTVKKIIERFDVDPADIRRIAICGNPIQLSIFQNIEIRDLAYAGKNKQKKLGVENVVRDARVFDASEIFDGVIPLPNCEIIVPPAIKHEIGADALAMMIMTDFYEQERPSLVTDYGTNAEMALKIGEKIITGSAAAGPAIEGQGISCGMLASPGAISDVNPEGDYWRITILDEDMSPRKAHLIDPTTGDIKEASDLIAKGITGTGVIASISVALDTGLIKKLPNLPNGKIILADGVEIYDRDIEEAGKAIGAIRAAHLTLLVEAGLAYEDLDYMYMSGATGAYIDADKARILGSCPNFSKSIVQFGNTSISLARELVFDGGRLENVKEVANRIKADHLMMAESKTFSNFYVCELSYWTQGMPIETYNQMLEMYGLPTLPEPYKDPVIEKRVIKDIDEVGKEGLEVVKNLGIVIEEEAPDCILCRKCEEECPEDAIIALEEGGKKYVHYDSEKCLGTSCHRCVAICPVDAIHYIDIDIKTI